MYTGSLLGECKVCDSYYVCIVSFLFLVLFFIFMFNFDKRN